MPDTAIPATADRVVLSAINHLRRPPAGGKPTCYLSDPPPGVPRNNAELDPRIVPIRDGRARLSVHGAFDDPTSPPDAPRESIEVRTLVSWAPLHPVDA